MRIYVINVATATARRENMAKRLRFHGVLDESEFIDAVTPDDDLCRDFAVDYPGPNVPVELCCFLSHLKAVHRVLVDCERYGDEGAIVMEDDQVLINDFRSELARALESRPPGTTLILLSRYNLGYEGCYYINDHLMTIGPRTVGTGAYWVSREYARAVLLKYAAPFRRLSLKNDVGLTAELFTLESQGLATRTLMSLSECTTSMGGHVRNSEHFGYFKQLHPERYADADFAGNISGFLQNFGLEREPARIVLLGWDEAGEDTLDHYGRVFQALLKDKLQQFQEIHVYNGAAQSVTPPPRSERPRTTLVVQYSESSEYKDVYDYDLNIVDAPYYFANAVWTERSGEILRSPLESDAVTELAGRISATPCGVPLGDLPHLVTVT